MPRYGRRDHAAFLYGRGDEEVAPEPKKEEPISKTKPGPGLADANAVVAGIKAGSQAVDSVTKLVATAAEAADRAKRTQMEIDEKNGALEREIAKNASRRREDLEKDYDQKRGERWFKYGSYSPPALDLKRFRVTKDEVWAYERGGTEPPGAAAKLERANDALWRYIQKAKGLNDDFETKSEVERKARSAKELQKAELANQKAQKELEAAELKMREVVARAKKEGVDIDASDLGRHKDESGNGRPNHQIGMRGGSMTKHRNIQRIAAIYPNPAMMSGMMSK